MGSMSIEVPHIFTFKYNYTRPPVDMTVLAWLCKVVRQDGKVDAKSDLVRIPEPSSAWRDLGRERWAAPCTGHGKGTGYHMEICARLPNGGDAWWFERWQGRNQKGRTAKREEGREEISEGKSIRTSWTAGRSENTNFGSTQSTKMYLGRY